MAHCPVCNQEYTEGTVEFCPRCSWYLIPYRSILGEIPSEIQIRDQQTLLWAKRIWQELETAKKVNQSSQNNSFLENYLQNISNNTQSLPEILNLLQHINKHLVDQFRNFDLLFQSKQSEFQEYQTSPNETSSENEVYERQDLSNSSEYNPEHDHNTHNIIDDPELSDLVKNYNEHRDFPDKIEVSETEYSKSQRWNGSQEPAVFELNHKGRGDYWIINNQYLVPKPKQKINEHSYQTISILFQCVNYEQNAMDNMTLIKPAKVSSISGQEKWQLAEIGSLEF